MFLFCLICVYILELALLSHCLCVCVCFVGKQIVHVVFSKHRLANYAVGNYVFLNFPQISFWEWHPFTLSSGPHDEYNEVHIKSLGDFTGKLYARAQQAASLKQKLWLRVDGPYGKFSLNHNRYPVVVLVAGGVGVTPSIACLKDIYRIRMSVVRYVCVYVCFVLFVNCICVFRLLVWIMLVKVFANMFILFGLLHKRIIIIGFTMCLLM